jgi:ribosomal protein S18 acetylase RimI-like enzyme
MQIKLATHEYLSDVARLFDLYRQFYSSEPDIDLAREYIGDRMDNEESTIFIAVNDKSKVMGFTQLYPSFCSVDATKILILYDLYVDAGFRKRGVGEALMNRATAYARECGASRLDLLTAKTNIPGQTLYEKLGYKKVLEDFYAYSLALN